MIGKKTTIKLKSNYNAFYAPRPFWKRKTCILAPVGRSICRPSVVSSLLFTALLDSCPTSYRSYLCRKEDVQTVDLYTIVVRSLSHDSFACKLVPQLLLVNTPFWFSGHVVKGHCQTACLCTHIVHLIFFDFLYLSLAKFSTIVVPSA